MKLVIHTQFKENYGAHDWDGRECPQYWKFKGGSTYVVEASLNQAMSGSFFTDVASASNIAMITLRSISLARVWSMISTLILPKLWQSGTPLSMPS